MQTILNEMNLMDSLLSIMQVERPFDVDALTEPFPAEDVKQRKGRLGKTIDYVKGRRIIQRLNDATDNRWSNLIWWTQKNEGGSYVDSRGEVKEYGPHWCALVTVIIPGMGARTQVGSKAVTGDEEDDIKAAITDGIKKAATLFGVALDLYDDSDEGDSSHTNRAPAQGAQASQSGRGTAQRSQPRQTQTPSGSPPVQPSPPSPASSSAQPAATTQRRTVASTDGNGRFLATQSQRDFIVRLLNERMGLQGEEAAAAVVEMAQAPLEQLTKEEASSLIQQLLQTHPEEG